ncbi:hypothetical protein ACFWPU_00985 [Streptomyces sp. NPDC058471]|uniref:hypothetical protein n=1 Tax=Streptomyces sp. NPDC058471 TaxID=3346516 RepID=UPI0036477AE3
MPIMTNVMDFQAANGVPFRAVVEGDKVSFYDRRYNHTEHGQFTGGRYYHDTLLDDAPRLRESGLNLYGGVDSWRVDAKSMDAVLTWLDAGQPWGAS